MRKNILLGLGLMVIVGSVMSLSAASRYQYHQFQRYGYTVPNQQDHRHSSVYRPHSKSVQTSYAGYYRNLSRRYYRPKCDARDEYGCHYFNKQALYRPAKDELDYKLQRPNLNPRIENTFQSNRLVVRNGNYKDRVSTYRGDPRTEDLQVVDAGYYTVDTTAFVKDGNGTYRQNGSSLAFRVLQSPGSYKCSQTNFWACVNRLTSNFQASQNISSVYNVNQDFRWNDTQYLSFARFPTVSESFDAAGRTYYILSALNPVDGSIVRIEGVSQARDKNQTSQAMYQVFESFRFRQ